MDEARPSLDPAPAEDHLPISPAVGCLLSVVVGLLCAGAFSLILWFNSQGQFVYAPEPYRTTRVWILRGVEGRGLGVSTTRPLPGGTADRTCAVTSVRFYMLSGGGAEAAARYCECFERAESGWVNAGGCPE